MKADEPVRAGARSQPGGSGLDAERLVVPPAAPLSVWGIHDSQNPPNDPRPSGCGYFRIVLPFDQLKANGWKAEYATNTPPARVAEFKVLVAERLDKPEVLGDWRRRKLQHKLVYELDDDLWHVSPLNTMAYRTYGIRSVQDAAAMCCTFSDMVTVSTEPLAEEVRKQSGNDNVVVIPNFISAALLEMERPRREHFTIGWMGGASHSLDLAVVAPAVRRVMEADTSLRLHVVGSDFRPTLGQIRARHTKWEACPADMYRHLDFDVGLAPIEATQFNESKSYLKALEYGALGIPVIASDFGPYREFVVDGVTGFLVGKEKQWRDRIRLLAADADLRESMGAKARELAAQHTIEGNWDKWAAAYRSLL